MYPKQTSQIQEPVQLNMQTPSKLIGWNIKYSLSSDVSVGKSRDYESPCWGSEPIVLHEARIQVYFFDVHSKYQNVANLVD